jgi:hypothetical protein
MEVVVPGVGDEGEVAFAQRQPSAWIDERQGSERQGLRESAPCHRLTRERFKEIKIGHVNDASNIEGKREGDRNAGGH